MFSASKKKIKKSKIPEYDVATEKRLAYGPPDFNRSLLLTKIVPKETEIDEIASVSKVTETYEEPPKDPDVYADVDSNIDIEITNKAVLEEKIHKLNQSQDSDQNDLNDSNKTEEFANSPCPTTKLSLMQKKLKLFKETKRRTSEGSASSTSYTTNKDSSTSDDVRPKNKPDPLGSDDVKKKKNTDFLDSDNEEGISNLVAKINLEYEPKSLKSEIEKRKTSLKTSPVDVKNNVNPFKNVDANMSVFVEKLVSPVLMVHNKMNYPIEPCCNIRDVNFNTHIHIVLKNIGIERPMMLQMVSWPVILRGYSLFMIGPLGSGKTFGYLPAVCRLITDDCKTEFVGSVGPTCIIVCATAQSVSEVEHYAKMFLGLDEKVVSCYAGVDDLLITTSLLNGCDLFICTPSVLVRLLQLTDFGIDLRRLATFVLDDCERMSEVYANEVQYFLIKIREMLKKRANKELKVQFVIASRVWCKFMETIAKKSPNSVISISAFQECVLYSKANTSVDFLKKENKINKVLDFMKEIDGKKKTVIVCRSDEEVDEVSKVLTKNKYVVFACDNAMTVEELYNLSKSWMDYQEPVLGPILICCDGNLNHLNVTDAHYLVHYSLPQLFSMFCKRFSVLNDNYPSIFREENESVRIKVFLEDSNIEQLPKILNFIKRCTDNVPEFLNKVCENVLQKKDLVKAQKLVPICDRLLAFGECPDFWNCQERHAIFAEYDAPKGWMPKNGVVTFKILHYHTPVKYSVRLLSNTTNGNTEKYPQTYSTLSLKMGMYFSKESNRRLHGFPEVGDVCAVSVKQNFFVRCLVLKILTRYNNKTPNCVLIKLIDEEKLEKTRDIYLFHLPEELKTIKTHIVQVRLANICPKDRDVTFSDLAKDSIKKITAKDEDLYFRGKVVLTVGNCIMVDTLEACQELTSLNETVVMHNLKKELLNTHAILNPDHIIKMGKLCENLITSNSRILCNSDNHDEQVTRTVPIKQRKEKAEPQWAHLEKDAMIAVYFASAVNPGTFFIRLVKFESCMTLLLKDIDKYLEGEPKSLQKVTIGDVVLARFPDDSMFERARIDDILNNDIVKCFFVDQGDWRDIQVKDLVPIPSKFITQIPFQAIECRLVGVKPVGDDWTEFGTNWFYDSCFDVHGDPKILYVRYFARENSDHTDGSKYAVVLIDTCSDQDVVINQLMIDLNLAKESDDEMGYLQELNLYSHREAESKHSDSCDSDEDALDDLPKGIVSTQSNSLVPVNSVQEEFPSVPLDSVFLKQPIRSVPLIDSDNESSESWDIGNPKDLVSILKGVTSMSINQHNSPFNVYKQTTKDPNQVNNTQSNDNSKIQEQSNDKIIKHPNESTQIPVNTITKDTAINGSSNNKTDKQLVIGIQNNIPVSNSLPKNASKIFSPLDSDDLSSAEDSLAAGSMPIKHTLIKEVPPNVLKKPDRIIPIDLNKIDHTRKPKLLWRQNKTSVSIKIQLIGVETYRLNLEDRTLQFEAICNDIKYGFDFDLYGVVDDIVHSDKGQYILVKFRKVIKKNWLTLTKDGSIRKWIVYDVDSIDTSSDEEEPAPYTVADVVSNIHNNDENSESDEDFLDDINYEYKRDFD